MSSFWHRPENVLKMVLKNLLRTTMFYTSLKNLTAINTWQATLRRFQSLKTEKREIWFMAGTQDPDTRPPSPSLLPLRCGFKCLHMHILLTTVSTIKWQGWRLGWEIGPALCSIAVQRCTCKITSIRFCVLLESLELSWDVPQTSPHWAMS